MAIVRLALGTPSANTDTLLHTATRQSLISLIATNTSNTAASISIWIKPFGTTTASQYAYMASNLVLPQNNSVETFRFALENRDGVYIRSSTSSVSFSINAIFESTGTQNITVSTVAPTSATIGDVFVNTANDVVYFWDGSFWVPTGGGSAGYAQPTQPTGQGDGAIWVDTDSVSPSYPEFPTVLYSPTEPTGLGVGDVGTIWVDEDGSAAVLNVNDYALKTYVDNLISSAGFNPFLLSGM